MKDFEKLSLYDDKGNSITLSETTFTCTFWKPTCNLRMNKGTLEQLWQGSTGQLEWKPIPEIEAREVHDQRS